MLRGFLSSGILCHFAGILQPGESGLPEDLRRTYYDRCIRIPMRPDARSLNLANSVAILTYEALRQLDFPQLSGVGEMGDV